MCRQFPQAYNFSPKTWILPAEMHTFSQQFDNKTRKSEHLFIVKPDAGAKGRGIFLTNNLDDVSSCSELMVAQK